MIATHDIQAGELLLIERPAIVGPCRESKLCCVNCYTDNLLQICGGCQVVPLCVSCTDRHDSIECEFFRTVPIDSSMFMNNIDLLAILRCIALYRSTDRRKEYEVVMGMESHCDQRRGTEIWQIYEKNVVQPLRSIDGLLSTDEDDAWLQRMCGILDVNSFEVRTAQAEVSY